MTRRLVLGTAVRLRFRARGGSYRRNRLVRLYPTRIRNPALTMVSDPVRVFETAVPRRSGRFTLAALDQCAWVIVILDLRRAYPLDRDLDGISARSITATRSLLGRLPLEGLIVVAEGDPGLLAAGPNMPGRPQPGCVVKRPGRYADYAAARQAINPTRTLRAHEARV